jgi:uncharacterized protein
VFLSTIARLLALVIIAASALAADVVPLPALQARVTDLTATLSAQQKADLESSLAQFEQARGSQIAILMLPSTKPETIEEFGIRLAEAWKIGRKGIDDGVIVVVAKDDRRMRLEVGYGLEGAVNDATAKRIISETMAPRFKGNDYYGGLKAGVAAIETVIEGEALPAPGEAGGRPPRPSFNGYEHIFVIGLVAAVLIGSFLRLILGNLLGASVTAAGTALAAWFVTASVSAAVIGAGVGFFVALFGMDLAWAFLSGRGRMGGGRGGFGGGFSGGGGGFGGGGASGNW